MEWYRAHYNVHKRNTDIAMFLQRISLQLVQHRYGIQSYTRGGTSAGVNFTITTASIVKKFLFDATHAETAGNADWVIDEDGSVPQQIPTPAQSTITSSTPETYWTGALSSWGIALVKLGNTVETLPSGTSITYGNSSNAQDLSHYDVFVVDEPIKFSPLLKNKRY